MCPDLVIRSTFIVGFPGENRKKEDFKRVCSIFCVKLSWNRVGCFTYSPWSRGAKANELAETQCQKKWKQERYERFMAVAQEISAAPRSYVLDVGQEMLVLH